ncbi:MAG: adenine deaminase C-terminal domain-containing protein [Chloroflexota bacterium]
MPAQPLHDLLIRGGRVVSTFTGEVFAADVVVDGQTIAGVLPADTAGEAREVLDASGLLVVPGYIDSHLHVESSFVGPAGFAWLTLAHGTTTVLADPHEIVNVVGADGLRWMLEAGANVPQSIYYGVPSCVPALPGFESSGAALDADDIAELLDLPGVIGLAEVMDYRAVVRGDERMARITEVAREKGVLIDGHAPNLRGEDLSKFMSMGIDSDHTKNPPEVSLEKARLGMTVQIQEKCVSPAMIQSLMGSPLRIPFCLVTDDVAPDAVSSHGHLDHVARLAIEAGLPPIEALRAMTLTPAQRLRLYDRGVVSPGKRADLVLTEDIAELRPRVVISGGRVVARDGACTYPEPTTLSHPFGATVKLGAVSADDFRWRLDLPDGETRLRAVRTNPVDTFTADDEIQLRVQGGEVQWEGRCPVLAIWERHGLRPGSAVAPILGFDLSEGAVASTYAHDSHNLVVLGTSRRSMATAANAVITAGGGIAVARGDEVVAELPLRIAGVMSERPVTEVVARARAIRAALDAWGYRHANAFMSFSTISLPVSPSLKLTNLGLVDVANREWADAVVSAH